MTLNNNEIVFGEDFVVSNFQQYKKLCDDYMESMYHIFNNNFCDKESMLVASCFEMLKLSDDDFCKKELILNKHLKYIYVNGNWGLFETYDDPDDFFETNDVYYSQGKKFVIYLLPSYIATGTNNLKQLCYSLKNPVFHQIITTGEKFSIDGLLKLLDINKEENPLLLENIIMLCRHFLSQQVILPVDIAENVW
ncbi:MAG: hypothetical protein MJ010_03985 [Paludibacteraceae bacterium]|nr:hypothetical protein [Paludibacteraceae bacterium]